jgi:hypothetical protein
MVIFGPEKEYLENNTARFMSTLVAVERRFNLNTRATGTSWRRLF